MAVIFETIGPVNGGTASNPLVLDLHGLSTDYWFSTSVPAGNPGLIAGLEGSIDGVHWGVVGDNWYGAANNNGHPPMRYLRGVVTQGTAPSGMVMVIGVQNIEGLTPNGNI